MGVAGVAVGVAVGVTVIAVRPVVRWPQGITVKAHGTLVPVKLIVGVVPTGIRVVRIVPGIHRRVGCPDSETAGSEACGNREGTPRILSGRGVRAPGDRESDQESRPHQFCHDVLLGRSSCYPLHRPCHSTSPAGSSCFLGQGATPAGVAGAGLSSHWDGHRPITGQGGRAAGALCFPVTPAGPLSRPLPRREKERKLGSTQSGAWNEGLRFNRPNSSRSNLGHRPPVASAIGNARAARVSAGSGDGRAAPDRWGRILFGLKLSMARPTVLTLDASRREEKPASFVPFRRQKFQARRVRGPT